MTMLSEQAPAKRRSRMHRVPTGKRVQITARDIEILKLLHRYRYLRSTTLHAFVGGASETRFKERLGHLYHEGNYIERPAQQWQFANSRYMPVVYELGEAGAFLLHELGLIGEGPLAPRGRVGFNRQFSHALMVSDVLASVELGVRAEPSLRFVTWPEILARLPAATRQTDNPSAIPVSITYRSPHRSDTYQKELYLVPDALFGLEYSREGKKTYRFFALEADRNTMPVTRSAPGQSSYLRKLLAYAEILKQGLYRTRLGLPNLLVLTVTTSERHMNNIMDVMRELGGSPQPFLFRTIPETGGIETAQAIPSVLTGPWLRADGSTLRIDQ